MERRLTSQSKGRFATGPWIKSSDVEPPKDGRWMVGEFPGNQNKYIVVTYNIPSRNYVDHRGHMVGAPYRYAIINEPDI